jgi:hypothetical protein
MSVHCSGRVCLEILSDDHTMALEGQLANVRFTPERDVEECPPNYSIISSARAMRAGGAPCHLLTKRLLLPMANEVALSSDPRN